ncbi:MAG: hypothetical protein Q8L07_13425 [Sediminibacterium sp.]|nr:hypothetical protein [Sediminibacterium sp.]
MPKLNFRMLSSDETSCTKSVFTILPVLFKNSTKELVEVYKQSLLMVTNDKEFALRTHRIIEMEDGHIINIKSSKAPLG